MGQRSALSPTNCKWRVVAPGDGGRDEASCRFLAQLLGPGRDRATQVQEDACIACCKTFAPTFETLNPVIASLVYDRAKRLSDLTDDQNDANRLRSLHLWAEQHLEIEIPALPLLAGAPLPQVPSSDRRPLRELFPSGTSRFGSRVRHWSVGVTTAPRRQSYLGTCLQSLADAGWPQPHLFIDGEVSPPTDWSHLPMTSRDRQVGAWPNFYLALLEMLLRDPLADAYLLVQDDALFYQEENLREYLEEVLWPGASQGIASLYCASPDAREKPGWYQYPGRWKYGAVAIIFPRDLALQFVIAPAVLRHRWSDVEGGKSGIPDVIAAWAESTGTAWYFPTPSLVQHIGESSAIWLGSYKLTRARRAEASQLDFPSPNFLPTTLIHTGLSDDFPEAAFPCAVDQVTAYRDTVRLGYRRARESKAVLCGLCRDAAHQLPVTIVRLERTARLFGNCHIVVYENDSEDDTPGMLQDWAASNSQVHIVSERLAQPRITNLGTDPFRTERMAYYRNRCRETVLSTNHDCEYVLVFDLDLVGGWSYDGIAHTLGHDKWDMVGSNGISFRSIDDIQSYEYADAFAFRRPGQRVHSGTSHALRRLRGEALVPVWSCFGGLGIYRRDAFAAATYSGEDCEHVTFHQALRERGFDRMFMNPSQIVSYSPWSPRK